MSDGSLTLAGSSSSSCAALSGVSTLPQSSCVRFMGRKRRHCPEDTYRACSSSSRLDATCVALGRAWPTKLSFACTCCRLDFSKAVSLSSSGCDRRNTSHITKETKAKTITNEIRVRICCPRNASPWITSTRAELMTPTPMRMAITSFHAPMPLGPASRGKLRRATLVRYHADARSCTTKTTNTTTTTTGAMQANSSTKPKDNTSWSLASICSASSKSAKYACSSMYDRTGASAPPADRANDLFCKKICSFTQPQLANTSISRQTAKKPTVAITCRRKAQIQSWPIPLTIGHPASVNFCAIIK
mmetsp:Transcript_17751/g.42675  ORF Transcript_17751/g.42675 Transcript_17751/m.42675 type:complete len:303 (-) Transcript_17751:1854-2762(-)